MECKQYLKRFFRFDRVRDLMFNGDTRSTASATVCLLRADEIEQEDYRNSYRGTAVSERLSLLRSDCQGRWIALNLYRGAESGSFSSNEVLHLCSLAPLIGEFVQQHVDLTRPPEGHSVQQCRQRLQELEPALTERELEVCSLILKGLTTNEIALDLQVKPSSVICYRKRAYARLQVANHKELHSRCF